jgi:hypothetical protein
MYIRLLFSRHVSLSIYLFAHSQTVDRPGQHPVSGTRSRDSPTSVSLSVASHRVLCIIFPRLSEAEYFFIPVYFLMLMRCHSKRREARVGGGTWPRDCTSY